MIALAAARLGYRSHVFCPDLDSPAAQVTDRSTLSGYGDRAALDVFAGAVDVVTYEFENIPHEAVAHLASRVPVRPAPAALSVCQDRLAEKIFVATLDIGTAAFRAVPDRLTLAPALLATGLPVVLKANRMGYDGKSQVLVRSIGEAEEAWQAIGAQPAIVEQFVEFEAEASVIAARALDGDVLCYPIVENRHRNHILSETIAPARVAPAVATAAEGIARTLAQALDIVGLLAVEMVLLADGTVLVNELAPRPHNSGHWTLDACATDQFEQLVRAICGLPLGSVDCHADAVMTNLLGDDAGRWQELLADPAARLHLYGKAEMRPGRKMGHVTRLVRGSG